MAGVTNMSNTAPFRSSTSYYAANTTGSRGKLLAVVDAVFVVLVILGIVTDPTTKGLGDSSRALSYEHPWDDEAKGIKG